MVETRDEEGGVVRRVAESWAGAFRKRADGYTLEYRIPWSAVGLASAPQAKDVLANYWDVYWYDAEGRVMTARLIENVDSALARQLGVPPGFYGSYRPMWGKAVFSQRK
jgi:hypothetical protein